MTLNGVMALILRHFTVASAAHCVKVVEDVAFKKFTFQEKVHVGYVIS